MCNRIPDTLLPVVAVAALQLMLPVAVHAQTAAAPLILPGLPGETSLQQSVGNAVLTMCALKLDNNDALTVLQQDLHDQCHAIAVADIQAKGGIGSVQAPLGALQQVSGNEISAQGALATRVVSGQFANISGRLDALRLGSAAAAYSGRALAFSGPAGSNGSVANAGPQSFYMDNQTLDAATRGDTIAPGIALPLDGFQRSGMATKTAFVGDGRLRSRTSGGDAAQGSGNGGSEPAPGSVPNPWGLYVQGSYNFGHHDATSNEDPFDFHAASVTAGLDYNFGHAVLGASLGYDDYDAGFGTLGNLVSGGSAHVQGTSGSLYGEYMGQNWYVSGIATYGRLTTELPRVVDYSVTYNIASDPDPQPLIQEKNCTLTTCTVSVSRTFRGDPGGDTFAVGATAGYDFMLDHWELEPSATVSYRRASFSSFVESDTGAPGPGSGLALAFGDQTVDSLRSILGAALSRALSTPFGVVTPTVRVEWDHEFDSGVRTIGAHYAFEPVLGASCLSCFALPTDATPSNYGIAGAGVAMLLAHRVQVYLYDETLFGFANYRSNSVVLGVRANF